MKIEDRKQNISNKSKRRQKWKHKKENNGCRSTSSHILLVHIKYYAITLGKNLVVSNMKFDLHLP